MGDALVELRVGRDDVVPIAGHRVEEEVLRLHALVHGRVQLRLAFHLEAVPGRPALADERGARRGLAEHGEQRARVTGELQRGGIRPEGAPARDRGLDDPREIGAHQTGADRDGADRDEEPGAVKLLAEGRRDGLPEEVKAQFGDDEETGEDADDVVVAPHVVLVDDA